MLLDRQSILLYIKVIIIGDTFLTLISQKIHRKFRVVWLLDKIHMYVLVV